MIRRFCPICGKATGELIEGKCRGCFLKEKKVLRLPEKMEAKVCRECLCYLKRGRWTYVGDEIGEVLEEACADSIGSSLTLEDIEDAEVGIGVKEAEQPFKNLYEVSCLVEVKGKLHGMDYKETKEAEVRITLDLCKDCSRRKGGYYEAILQIRGEVPGEIQNKVRNMLDSLTKKDRRSFITDVKALKEGVDFYIGSIRAARKVARNLKQEYGGRIRESPKLMGMDKHGKKVYRVTIALRLQ